MFTIDKPISLCSHNDTCSFTIIRRIYGDFLRIQTETTAKLSLISKKTQAHIEIVEAETVELREMLLNETIHMTLLVDHTEVDKDKYEEYQLIRKEMAAFMKPQHPLSKKSILNCKLLEEYPHVTYNNKDSVYLLVKEKMTKHEVSVKLFFISSS